MPKLMPLRQSIKRGLKFARHSVAKALLQGTSLLTARFSSLPVPEGLYRSLVLSGPNRGLYISMPSLWRPAFVLGTYERQVQRAMQARVLSGTVAYDIGANIGFFTLMLAQLTRPNGGTVYAFEADPRNARALSDGIEVNGLTNVTVVPAAVSDSSGTVTFATFSYASISHIATATTPDDAVMITVPSLTLDEFVYRDGNAPPAFVKIDVEGAELRLLRGAVRVLREARPVIVAEIRADIWPEVQQLMTTHDYRWQVLEGGHAKEMGKSGLSDILFLPREKA